MTVPLKELLQQHRELRSRCEHLWHELDMARQELNVVDQELSLRFNALLEALGGAASSMPPRNQEADLPPRDRDMSRSSAAATLEAATRRFLITTSDLKRRHANPYAHADDLESLSNSWGTLSSRSLAQLVSRRENPLTEAIKTVLREAARPMKVSEIYDALLARDVEIPGKNPRNNLSAYLHNGTEFKKIEDGLWTLEEKEAA